MTYLASKTPLAVADAESGKSALKKGKTLQKFGRNPAITTIPATVAQFATGEEDETYISTNAIDSVASLNSGDTSIPLAYEGHTISGGAFTFVTGTATLDASDGQTEVSLSTAVARISRMYMTSARGASANIGNIVFYQSGAVSAGSYVTPTNVHGMIPAGLKQSFKGAATFSDDDTAYMTGVWAFLQKQGGTNNVYAEITLEIGLQGEIFRPRPPISINPQMPYVYKPFESYLIIPPNADVRLVAVASTGTLDISAGFDAILAN